MMRLGLVAVAAALGLAAPTVAAPGRLTAGERRWVEAVDAFATDLRSNVELAANGGGDLASARRALHDDSDLYATLVAYTYFGGCTATLRNVGAPSPRLAPAARALGRACRAFEHASALYARAVRRADPQALVAASSASLEAYAEVAATRVGLDGLRR
jgi:hypothetical protein